MTPEFAAAELLRRRRARASLVEYARFIEVPGAPSGSIDDDPDESLFYRPVETLLARHHEIILSATQRCIERQSGRTMLFLPPGSAKSTYATVVAPTWVMGARPGFKTIAVSYGTDLARKFGRRMRSICRQPGYRALFSTGLSSESSAAHEWALDNGSEFMGGGILSGITGNRADFIPIDDPIKGRQEAESDTIRKSTIEAYQDDILTRLKPGGSLMLTQTRWSEADLAGSILPEKWAGESGMIECRDGNTWEVICIQAKCTRRDDPLGRQFGEYLWPEWFPENHWRPFERISRTWSALYQQIPTPDEGIYFRREWFRYCQELPKHLRYYGASDYAVTADGGDYTVHIVVGIDPDDNMYVVDLWRAQTDSNIWIDEFCGLIKRYKPLMWAEEQGQILKSLGPFIDKRMRELKAYCAREQLVSVSDKPTRARSFQARMSMGKVYFPIGAPWLADFESELLSFPAGKNDDQVDAAGLAGRLLDEMVPAHVPPAAATNNLKDYGYTYGGADEPDSWRTL
jgi:predicted phage terminase large subunit-like protein